MLAHGVVGVVAHAAVHAVDAAGNGLGQSAAPYDGVELEGDALGLKPVDDGLPAQVVLVHNLLEALQLVGVVLHGGFGKHRTVVVHGELG